MADSVVSDPREGQSDTVAAMPDEGSWFNPDELVLQKKKNPDELVSLLSRWRLAVRLSSQPLDQDLE